MAKTRKTFVEFYFPGLIFANNSIREVKDRNIKNLKVPKNAFGFRFFDIFQTTVLLDGKKHTLKSERLKISPMYYYGGRVMTLAEVKREMGNEKILIANMENNDIERVVKSNTGGYYPLRKGDKFVEAK